MTISIVRGGISYPLGSAGFYTIHRAQREKDIINSFGHEKTLSIRDINDRLPMLTHNQVKHSVRKMLVKGLLKKASAYRMGTNIVVYEVVNDR